jgi:hypothetical protein
MPKNTNFQPILQKDENPSPSTGSSKQSVTVPSFCTQQYLQISWGIASQVILLIIFVMIGRAHAKITSMHMPMALVLSLCCIVHISCNLTFFKKFIVPACDESSEDEKMIEEYKHDEEVGEKKDTMNGSSRSSNTVFVIMIIFFCLNNLVSELRLVVYVSIIINYERNLNKFLHFYLLHFITKTNLGCVIDSTICSIRICL